MVIHILIHINAEREGQPKSREQGAWGWGQNMSYPEIG